jgi:hypothetical protein
MPAAAWSLRGVGLILCVLWCAVAPAGWHVRPLLERALPGFVRLSVGSLVLGLAQSVALGAYSGALIALLHDRLAGADAHVKATSVRA